MKWIKRLSYFTLRFYVKVGLWVYFKKVEVQGLENIPSRGPVFFTANHQNSFLDALLVATTTKRYCHYLVSSVFFKKRLARAFLFYFNMFPIYRIRDGWKGLRKMESTFQYSEKVFLKEQALLIFPEGNHAHERRLRPLTKGFVRILFGVLDNAPEIKIPIVPVGINYSNHTAFGGKVSVWYGKPIYLETPSDRMLKQEKESMVQRLSDEMKTLIVHVEDAGNYDTIMARLEKEKINLLNPVQANFRIKQLELENLKAPEVQEKFSGEKRKGIVQQVFYWMHFPLFKAWRNLERKIVDKVYVGSLKFTFGLFVFPLYYGFIGMSTYFFSSILLATYLVLGLLFSTLLVTKS